MHYWELLAFLDRNSNGVFAFSLRKPCKEGKGNKKDGLFTFAFFFKKKKKKFSLYIASLKNFIAIKHFMLGMHFCVPLNN